jgi:hypothetical protein
MRLAQGFVLLLVLALFSAVGIGQRLSRVRALKRYVLGGERPAALAALSCSFISRHASSESAHQRTAFRRASMLSATPASDPNKPPIIREHSRSVKSVRAGFEESGSAMHNTIASARARRQGPEVPETAERSAKNKKNIVVNQLEGLWLA